MDAATFVWLPSRVLEQYMEMSFEDKLRYMNMLHAYAEQTVVRNKTVI